MREGVESETYFQWLSQEAPDVQLHHLMSGYWISACGALKHVPRVCTVRPPVDERVGGRGEVGVWGVVVVLRPVGGLLPRNGPGVSIVMGLGGPGHMKVALPRFW